jgi:hypothetical protein
LAPTGIFVSLLFSFLLLTLLISFLVSAVTIPPSTYPHTTTASHCSQGGNGFCFWLMQQQLQPTTTGNTHESGHRQQWHHHQCQRQHQHQHHVTEPPPCLRATAHRGKWWC